MSPRAPERPLRRRIAELAALHQDDVTAVLDSLDDGKRGAVESLLREYAAGVADLRPVPPYDASRISPWIVRRLGEDGPMTAHARLSLLDSAQQLFPAPPEKARRRWFGRKFVAPTAEESSE